MTMLVILGIFNLAAFFIADIGFSFGYEWTPQRGYRALAFLIVGMAFLILGKANR